ncbi:centrosomal protein of 295 kDa [Gouania willdenowi]|uniref:centrosomal protein of 295 kDa n=1 Tax=Gouania willdenowi TaxID=441366 RepID=UPI001055DFD7|nr:centrosomal protein of 295 kDa [Gouania willdenowi]
MKQAVNKLRPSPNEEARILKEERDRRRKLRLQQVRQQQRHIAQQILREVAHRRQHELQHLEQQLRLDWEHQQRDKLHSLQTLYQQSLQLLGQSHRSAKENEPDLAAIAQRAEQHHVIAEQRHREALKELKAQRIRDNEMQNRSIHARKKALQTEKKRSAKVSSLPPPPPNPLQEIRIQKPPVVRRSDVNAFSSTRYHMPESTVEREDGTQQPDAHKEAELEARRLDDLQKEEKRRRKEQLEKAQLRGREALRREQLEQDRERLLVELEHMQQSDLLRRRQQVSAMPPQIFLPLYKRQETRDDQQRELEFAFEDMYTGERRVKGDLVLQLVPEPLPAASTCSQDQDQELDVTLDDTSSQQEAEQETSAEVESSKRAPRRALRKLLDRIRSQRNLLTDLSSNVQSSESPTSSDQIPERESTIETGSLVSDKKEAPDLRPPLENFPATEAQLSDELTHRIQDKQRRKDEELEREKQQQILLLQELEEQKTELEHLLFEAQQQKEELTAAVNQSEEPVGQSEHSDEELISVSQQIPTDFELPADEAEHVRRIKEYQQRLLEQNRLHQRSVEVAQQRLDAYQRALQIRYNLTASSQPLDAPPSVHIHPQQQQHTQSATYEQPTHQTFPGADFVEFPAGSASEKSGSLTQRENTSLWLTGSLMQRVSQHLPERLRASTDATDRQSAKQDVSESTTELRSSSHLHSGSVSSKEEETMENQRRKLQHVQRRVSEQRESVRQQEAEHQREQEVHKEQMRRQKEALQALIHINQEPASERTSEDMSVSETRRRLLGSLLKAIEESHGGSLSHLEEPPEREPLQTHRADRVVLPQSDAPGAAPLPPPPAALLLHPPRPADPPPPALLLHPPRPADPPPLPAALLLHPPPPADPPPPPALLLHPPRPADPPPPPALLLHPPRPADPPPLPAALLLHPPPPADPPPPPALLLHPPRPADPPPPPALLLHPPRPADPPPPPALLLHPPRPADPPPPPALLLHPPRPADPPPPPALLLHPPRPADPPPPAPYPALLLHPPRAAHPPLTRVRLGLGEMSEQHELSVITEVETLADSSRFTGPLSPPSTSALTAQVSVLEESRDLQEEPDQNHPWTHSEGTDSDVSLTHSSEKSSFLTWRERILTGTATSPESSSSVLYSSGSDLRRFSSFSSNSGRGADGSAASKRRSKSPFRPVDTDGLSSSISSGSYVSTDPNTDRDQLTTIKRFVDSIGAASPPPAAPPSFSSPPAVESMFADSSIQRIIDRYTRELDQSLSSAGRTTDTEGSYVDEREGLASPLKHRPSESSSRANKTSTNETVLDHLPGVSQSQAEDSFRPLIGQPADQSSCLAPEHASLQLLVGQPTAHSSMISVPHTSEQAGWDSALSRMMGPLSHQSGSVWMSDGRGFSEAPATAGQEMSDLSLQDSVGESRMRPLVAELDESEELSGSSGGGGASTPVVHSQPTSPPEGSNHTSTVAGSDPHHHPSVFTELDSHGAEVLDSFHPLQAELTTNQSADISMIFDLPPRGVPNSPGVERGLLSPCDESWPEQLRADESQRCEETSPQGRSDSTPLLMDQEQTTDSTPLLMDQEQTSVIHSELKVCEVDQLHAVTLFPDWTMEKGILDQSEITLLSVTDTTLQDSVATVTEEEEGQRVEDCERTSLPEDGGQTCSDAVLELHWSPSDEKLRQKKLRALLHRSTHRVEMMKAKRAEDDSRTQTCSVEPKPDVKSKRNQSKNEAGAVQRRHAAPSGEKLQNLDTIKICTPETRKQDVSAMHRRTRRLWEQLEEVKQQNAVRSRRDDSAKNRLKAKEFHEKTLQKLRAKQSRQ